jgi:hypothetical protein
MSDIEYSKPISYTNSYTHEKRREWKIKDVHAQEYRLTQRASGWTLERNGGWMNDRVLWDFRGSWQCTNLREAKKVVAEIITGRRAK